MNEDSNYLIPWNPDDEHEIYTTEILVLGSGIAGLFAAINLSDRFNITILTKKNIMAGNTEHAQGGIAVALNQDDSPEFHFGDTIKAGAGLCNLEAVRILAEKGPECVEQLIKIGAQFDRLENRLDFTREAAHSKNRVLHAKGDATGGEIERALVAKVQDKDSNISVRENYFVIDLLKNKENRVCGVLAYNENKLKLEIWLAKAVILATGGLGQLYKYTTNPPVTTGDGLAAAYRAGAELMDMEFIQFHPTALLLSGAPSFLISEAARGEGAKLLNSKGERFMHDIPGQELAPRDIVAREIWAQMKEGTVYLDVSCLGQDKVQKRFPGIYKTCLEYGIDISKSPVPVGPATHFLMGGVKVNIDGETNLAGLYACGECACNGVHGANRLASNSLLDGLVFASIVAEKIKENPGPLPKKSDLKVPLNQNCLNEKINSIDPEKIIEELKQIMWDKVGIIRDRSGLLQAEAELTNYRQKFSPGLNTAELELGNMLILSLLIVKSALAREESRGGHYRSDFPLTNIKWQKHSVIKKGDTRVRYVSI
ncbi:MAG: L-aspartate oxidase [Peptococcaceae bacterium]|nr:L-aspartate oxidase [Peptococcaceae bacterium]